MRWTLQEVLVHPLEPVALGLIFFSLCCAYWWFLRRSRVLAATVTALLLAAVRIAQLDWQVPLTPGHAAREVNVRGAVSATEPTQRLVLAAHYDTKTEMTDHIVRFPVQIAGGILVLVGILATPFATRPRSPVLRRVLGGSILAFGALFAFVFSGGALQPRRFAGEEVGAQGSRAFVDDHLSGLPARRTIMVNLDPVGASRDLTVVHGERGLLRSFAPDRSVVSLLDAAHHRVMGRPIGHTRGGGITDAFPFGAVDLDSIWIVP